MQPQEFQRNILAWFDRSGRKDLPWQQDINAYNVWLSEIMLQQTQVATVIPYFNRFITRFPDLQHLAAATLDEVMPYWAGLGYYARARNLHKTACLLYAQGGFPQNLEAMMALPGIGRSTAGAILSIVFQQKQPILDGNVKRVLSRCFAVAGWAGEAKVMQELWQLSAYYTPAERSADYTQAMMDLGATVCTRSRPKCVECPLQAVCQAKQMDAVKAYPAPKPRQVQPVKQCCFLMLQTPVGEVFLVRRPETGIWGGLWVLPQFETIALAEAWCSQQSMQVIARTVIPERRHTFSHYCLDYTTLKLSLANYPLQIQESGDGGWFHFTELAQLGLPAPIKRLLQQYDQGVIDGENN